MILYRRAHGKKVFKTTPEKWEALQASPRGRRNFVLVEDLTDIERIEDKPIIEEEEE